MAPEWWQLMSGKIWEDKTTYNRHRSTILGILHGGVHNVEAMASWLSLGCQNLKEKKGGNVGQTTDLTDDALATVTLKPWFLGIPKRNFQMRT